MRNFFLNIFFIFLFACKAHKPVVEGVKNISDTTKLVSDASKIDRLLDQNKMLFSFLSFKLHTNYDDGDRKVNLVSKVRIKKDSIIWISSDLLGFEVARTKITKDSIIILNRVYSKTMLSSFESLSKKIGFSLSFSTIQNILLGKHPIPFLENQNLQLINDSLYLNIFTLLERKSLADSSKYQYFTGIHQKTGWVTFWKIKEESNKHNSEVINAEFENISGPGSFKIPTKQKINTVFGKNIELKNEINKIDTVRLEFPFNIPLKYEKEIL